MIRGITCWCFLPDVILENFPGKDGWRKYLPVKTKKLERMTYFYASLKNCSCKVYYSEVFLVCPDTRAPTCLKKSNKILKQKDCPIICILSKIFPWHSFCEIFSLLRPVIAKFDGTTACHIWESMIVKGRSVKSKREKEETISQIRLMEPDCMCNMHSTSVCLMSSLFHKCSYVSAYSGCTFPSLLILCLNGIENTVFVIFTFSIAPPNFYLFRLHT